MPAQASGCVSPPAQSNSISQSDVFNPFFSSCDIGLPILPFHTPMRHDPNEILCEACGYSIDALPTDAPCPECGRPASESSPSRRTGSPWQQQPGFRTWARTALAFVFWRSDVWDSVRIENDVSRGLLITNVFLAAVIYVVLRTVSFGGHEIYPDLMVSIPLIVVVFLVVFHLSRLEEIGIRFFARRHGWRTTSEVSSAVVGHASIGWLAGVLFMSALIAVVIVIEHVAGYGLFTRGDGVLFLLIAADLLLPMLWFESLVYIGWRRTRYANHPTQTPVAQPTAPPSNRG